MTSESEREYGLIPESMDHKPNITLAGKMYLQRKVYTFYFQLIFDLKQARICLQAGFSLCCGETEAAWDAEIV